MRLRLFAPFTPTLSRVVRVVGLGLLPLGMVPNPPDSTVSGLGRGCCGIADCLRVDFPRPLSLFRSIFPPRVSFSSSFFPLLAVEKFDNLLRGFDRGALGSGAAAGVIIMSGSGPKDSSVDDMSSTVQNPTQ